MENDACISPSPIYGAGIGLRYQHHEDVLNGKPRVNWLEVHSENYFGGGLAIDYLKKIRLDYPISLHGVGLSLGSSENLSQTHLEKFKQLIHRISPTLVSEHLSWSIINGVYLNDLIPTPYTDELLAIVSRHVDETQNYFKRQILIENPSTYLEFKGADYSEADFLSALVKKTGCGLLLDVNNIFVSSKNHGFNANEYLLKIPPEAVKEIHLAGHTKKQFKKISILLDDHGSKVDDEVWALYQQTLKIMGRKPTLIEWDSNIPALDIILDQARIAENYLEQENS